MNAIFLQCLDNKKNYVPSRERGVIVKVTVGETKRTKGFKEGEVEPLSLWTLWQLKYTE